MAFSLFASLQNNLFGRGISLVVNGLFSKPAEGQTRAGNIGMGFVNLADEALTAVENTRNVAEKGIDITERMNRVANAVGYWFFEPLLVGPVKGIKMAADFLKVRQWPVVGKAFSWIGGTSENAWNSVTEKFPILGEMAQQSAKIRADLAQPRAGSATLTGDALTEDAATARTNAPEQPAKTVIETPKAKWPPLPEVLGDAEHSAQLRYAFTSPDHPFLKQLQNAELGHHIHKTPNGTLIVYHESVEDHVIRYGREVEAQTRAAAKTTTVDASKAKLVRGADGKLMLEFAANDPRIQAFYADGQRPNLTVDRSTKTTRIDASGLTMDQIRGYVGDDGLEISSAARTLTKADIDNHAFEKGLNAKGIQTSNVHASNTHLNIDVAPTMDATKLAGALGVDASAIQIKQYNGAHTAHVELGALSAGHVDGLQATGKALSKVSAELPADIKTAEPVAKATPAQTSTPEIKAAAPEATAAKATAGVSAEHQYAKGMGKVSRRMMMGLGIKEMLTGDTEAGWEYMKGAVFSKSAELVMHKALSNTKYLGNATLGSFASDVLKSPLGTAGRIVGDIGQTSLRTIFSGDMFRALTQPISVAWNAVRHPFNTVGNLFNGFGDAAKGFMGSAKEMADKVVSFGANNTVKAVGGQIAEAGAEKLAKEAMEAGAEKAAKTGAKFLIKNGLMKTVGAVPLVGGVIAGAFGYFEYKSAKEMFERGECTQAQLDNTAKAIKLEVGTACISGWLSDSTRYAYEATLSQEEMVVSRGTIGTVVDLGKGIIGVKENVNPRTVNPNVRVNQRYAVQEASGSSFSAPPTPMTYKPHIHVGV